MLFSLLKFIFIIFLVLVILATARTWQLQFSPNQKRFSIGTVATMPSGLYNGIVPGYAVSWKGKKFDASTSSGINIFDEGMGNIVDKYPFKTSIGKGIKDERTDVIKVNYNISVNPVWLRLILDEIVEVAPGEYLGKLHFRLIPGFPFTLGFFELKKQ